MKSVFLLDSSTELRWSRSIIDNDVLKETLLELSGSS